MRRSSWRSTPLECRAGSTSRSAGVCPMGPCWSRRGRIVPSRSSRGCCAASSWGRGRAWCWRRRPRDRIMSAFRVPPAWRLPEGVDRAPLAIRAHAPAGGRGGCVLLGSPALPDRCPDRSTSDSPRRAGWWTWAAARAGTRSGSPRGGSRSPPSTCPGSMLEVVGQKACAAGVDVLRVEANLCRLGCFADASFDYALSMFSTLGMIRGRDARRRALARMVPHPPPGRPAGAARA